jgi:hypothetical protein
MSNTNDEKYTIVPENLTYVMREDFEMIWEDGPLTGELMGKLATHLRASIEDMLNDRWIDMRAEAVRHVMDELSEGGE